jgi:hypothetical protein
MVNEWLADTWPGSFDRVGSGRFLPSRLFATCGALVAKG